MRHFFRTEHWVPYPVETVFAFFANPANLPRLMPAWQRARVEKAIYVLPPALAREQARPFAAGTGSRITISFRPVPLLPLRVPWDAVIADFAWNRSFCDEQRPRGPFHYWRHLHTVTREEQGAIEGTRVLDDLEYELPLRMFGDAANSMFVARQIRAIFAFRQKRLAELLASQSI
jgi:ligand-binding SRPBCC domain-containing protein